MQQRGRRRPRANCTTSPAPRRRFGFLFTPAEMAAGPTPLHRKVARTRAWYDWTVAVGGALAAGRARLRLARGALADRPRPDRALVGRFPRGQRTFPRFPARRRTRLGDGGGVPARDRSRLADLRATTSSRTWLRSSNCPACPTSCAATRSPAYYESADRPHAAGPGLLHRVRGVAVRDRLSAYGFSLGALRRDADAGGSGRVVVQPRAARAHARRHLLELTSCATASP